MVTANRAAGFESPVTMVQKTSGWFIAIAVAFIILGMMAMIEPMVAGLAVSVMVGWILIVAGVTHVVGASGAGGAGRVIWQFVLGAVYAIGGVYFLTHPLLGLGALTLVLSGILVTESVLRIVAYVQTRGERGSWSLLVNGLITILLGGMIWRHWPSSSAWAIGTLVGANLLMAGMSWLILGTAARTAMRNVRRDAGQLASH
jgi:uncharacterized membrane protein HdeD (DUF308 family)